MNWALWPPRNAEWEAMQGTKIGQSRPTPVSICAEPRPQSNLEYFSFELFFVIVMKGAKKTACGVGEKRRGKFK